MKTVEQAAIDFSNDKLNEGKEEIGLYGLSLSSVEHLCKISFMSGVKWQKEQSDYNTVYECTSCVWRSTIKPTNMICPDCINPVYTYQQESVECQKQQNYWIKVEDGLPKYEGLIVDTFNGICNRRAAYVKGVFERYVDIYDEDRRISTLNYSDITHWRKLPERPKK